jgi:transporter family-2 protein
VTSGSTAALAAAVVSGALVAFQQRVNGDLATSLHDPVLAAVVSFLTGLVLVAVVVGARPEARLRLPALATLPTWQRLGGLGGATLVVVGATAAPRIGVALLTVGLVAGSIVGGLLVDRGGLGPGGPRPLTPTRLAGAGLCLVAIAVSAAEGRHHASPVLLTLVLLAGGLVAVQQAVNGRARVATDATVATLQNFVVGTAALLVLLAFRFLAGDVRADSWPGPDRWWLYLGGPIGATFVAVAAVVVRRLGVLRLGFAVTGGQVVGGVLLDVRRGVAVTTLLGAALTLVAVALSGTARTVAVRR